MKKISWMIFFACFLGASPSADDKTKVDMRNVFENYLKMVPFIYDESVDDKNIIVYLKEFEKSFSSAKHGRVLKNPNFAPSANIILDSIKDIKSSLADKNEDYTRSRLKRILTTCTSCHSQLPKSSFEKISHNSSDLFKKYVVKNYEKAMVLYFLRDYDRSLEFLAEDISDLLGKKGKESTIEKRLREFLKISLENSLKLNNFEGQLKSFLKQSKQKGIVERIEGYLKDVKKWKGRNLLKKKTEKDINILIAKILSPIENDILSGDISLYHVDLYVLKGLLSRYIVENPNSKLNQKILYWVGVIENQYKTLPLYSLGNFFLEECIVDFPKSKVSKKCFKAYKNSIEFEFTGSSGTNIPKDIKAKINKLKEKI